MTEQIEIVVLEDEEMELKPPKTKKKTSSMMTKYEYAHIIGSRVLLLVEGYPPLIDTKGMMDPQEIAVQELHQRKIPLRIKRVLPGGEVEIWNINELSIRNY